MNDELRAHMIMPTTAISGAIKLAEIARKGGGIKIGLPSLNNITVPTQPGWVRIWVALPGVGKSTALKVLAKTEMAAIKRRGTEDSEYVAYVTYEEAAETLVVSFLNMPYSAEDVFSGNTDEEEFRRSAIKFADEPIRFLGVSLGSTGIHMPMTKTLEAIRQNYEMNGLKPSLLILDYIQEAHIDDMSASRNANIIRAYGEAVAVGVELECPIEMAAQAGKDAFANKHLVPHQNQIEWANYLAQKPPAVVGIGRPYLTPGGAEPVIEINKKQYQNHPSLVVFRALKNRYAALSTDYIPVMMHPNLTLQDAEPIAGETASSWENF